MGILNKEQLKVLLDNFYEWFNNDSHKENENAYQEFTNKSYWENTESSELSKVMYQFVYDGGKIQSNDKRSVKMYKDNNITKVNNTEKLRKLILQIFDDDFNIEKWWQDLYSIKGFGKGIRTILLLRIKPSKYPILNNKSKKGLVQLGYLEKPKSNEFKLYEQLQNAINDLINDAKEVAEPLNYYEADALMHYIIGVSEGRNLFLSLINTKDDSIINAKDKDFDNEVKNIILYGPPGTGKTYNTKRRALEIIVGKGEVNNDNIDDLYDKYRHKIKFVTFHQSFSYEQFVEGISAETEKGNIKYDIGDGIFKKFCLRAIEDLEDSNESKINYTSFFDENGDKDGRNVYFKDNNPYVLIIDEINRGNISKIFGELITLIEDDKRLGEDNEVIVTLPYSKKKFGIPPNLYIIGTMNTADRSLVQLDTALRRRFSFEEMMPNYDVDEIWENPNKVKELYKLDLKDFLKNLNSKITEKLDREHQIGHSYMMKIKDIESLQYTWENNILPLLQEYFYADYGTLGEIIGTGSCYLKNDDLTLKCPHNKSFHEEFKKIYDKLVSTKIQNENQ